MAKTKYLIIGGGHAGAMAALGLRKAGADGRVLLVSAEAEYPYLRYMLSKEYLRGQRPRDRLNIRPVKLFLDQGVEMLLGTRAVGLNAEAQSVLLDTGEEVGYEKLLLATGASLRRLPVPGTELPGVYHLRTLADADALREEIALNRKAVIIGGGFIGAEVAASFVQQGMNVTIVDVAETLWAHLFGEKMGRFFHEGLLKRGVDILTPVHVESIEGENRVRRVVTQEGHALDGDLVVVGIGVNPETELAEAAGLSVDNGILVDEYLESSRPGIFAAGDNARFYSPLFDARLRIEHWDVAGQQGSIAAANMLGQCKPFDEVPYFFSELFDMWVEFLGHAPHWDRLTLRTLGEDRFAAFYSQQGRVNGVLLVNNSKELKSCAKFIRSKTVIGDLTTLEDPDVDLGEVLTAKPDA